MVGATAKVPWFIRHTECSELHFGLALMTVNIIKTRRIKGIKKK